MRRAVFFLPTFLVLIVLFKPAESYGAYEWLIKSDIGILMSETIFFSSCLVLVAGAIATNLLFQRLSRRELKFWVPPALYIILSNLSTLYYAPNLFFRRVGVLLILFLATSLIVYRVKVDYFRRGARRFNFGHYLFLSITIGLGIYAAVSLVVILADPYRIASPDFAGSRFYVLADHPNFLGVISAITFAAALYLWAESSSRAASSLRVYLLFLIIFSLWLTINSGSRSSVAMVITSFFVFCLGMPWRPWIKAVVLTTLSGAAAVTIYAILTNAFESHLRVFSHTDTRSESWARMLSQFLQDPFFGVGFSRLTATESSVLAVAAASGLLGLASIVILMIKILLNAKKNKKLQILAYPLIVGSIFEGYLIDTFSLPILMTFILSLSITPSPPRNIRVEGGGKGTSTQHTPPHFANIRVNHVFHPGAD